MDVGSLRCRLTLAISGRAGELIQLIIPARSGESVKKKRALYIHSHRNQTILRR
jgi:hypothetical protein